MNGLLTPEQIFNGGFNTYSKNASLRELLSYAVKEGHIDVTTANDILSAYESSICNHILSNYSYDEEDDINLIVEEQGKELFFAIDDYLMSMNNPFEALKYIVNTNPTNVIEYTFSIYQEKQKNVQDKLARLQMQTDIISKNHREYSDCIKFLKDRITNPKVKTSLYTLMGGELVPNLSTLDETEAIIDRLAIEGSIVNKFSRQAIISFLKMFDVEDGTKNVATSVLYNYIFNAFYKDGHELAMTPAMMRIVAQNIQEGIFDVQDVAEIIETGEVEFRPEEKEYIYDHFKQEFERDIIENKYLDRIIRTK